MCILRPIICICKAGFHRMNLHCGLVPEFSRNKTNIIYSSSLAVLLFCIFNLIMRQPLACQFLRDLCILRVSYTLKTGDTLLQLINQYQFYIGGDDAGKYHKGRKWDIAERKVRLSILQPLFINSCRAAIIWFGLRFH